MDTDNPSPQSKSPKSIYDVGYGSIFFKNFLSGFARSLGAVAVYLLILVLLYYFFLTYILPRLNNFLPNIFSLLFPVTLQESSDNSGNNNAFTISKEQFETALDLLNKNQATASSQK